MGERAVKGAASLRGGCGGPAGDATLHEEGRAAASALVGQVASEGGSGGGCSGGGESTCQGPGGRASRRLLSSCATARQGTLALVMEVVSTRVHKGATTTSRECCCADRHHAVGAFLPARVFSRAHGPQRPCGLWCQSLWATRFCALPCAPQEVLAWQQACHDPVMLFRLHRGVRPSDGRGRLGRPPAQARPPAAPVGAPAAAATDVVTMPVSPNSKTAVWNASCQCAQHLLPALTLHTSALPADYATSGRRGGAAREHEKHARAGSRGLYAAWRAAVLPASCFGPLVGLGVHPQEHHQVR